MELSPGEISLLILLEPKQQNTKFNNDYLFLSYTTMFDDFTKMFLTTLKFPINNYLFHTYNLWINGHANGAWNRWQYNIGANVIVAESHEKVSYQELFNK